MTRFKVIEFKSFPYYWNLTKEGKKPFDLRLIDENDPRFQALSRWQPKWENWLIKLVNTETGEYLYYKIDDIHWFEPVSTWLTIYLGKEIKEVLREEVYQVAPG